jgi:hypothetical protein
MSTGNYFSIGTPPLNAVSRPKDAGAHRESNSASGSSSGTLGSNL